MKLTQLIKTKEEQEKREELELYIQVQEETYVDYAAKVEIARDKLHKHYKELEKKYEQKRQALIVVEAKLEFDLGSAKNHRRELEREIETLKYKNTMGEDKVHAILTRHKEQMRQMVSESLDKGWKTWSTQATELQLLRADHENRKKHGPRFFKIDETSINTVREELANDIYDLTAHHTEEINKMLDEFEDQQIATAMQLDAYEGKRHW